MSTVIIECMASDEAYLGIVCVCVWPEVCLATLITLTVFPEWWWWSRWRVCIGGGAGGIGDGGSG